MSLNDNATLARTFYEAFNSRDFDRALVNVAPDCELLNVPTGETSHGPEAFRQFDARWATAFPDGKIEVTNLIPAGDWVCVEFTGRGTNDGPLAGPAGQIPPTGRRVELRFCDLLHFQNGKLISLHTYYDMATMLQQLGLMPLSKQAGK